MYLNTTTQQQVHSFEEPAKTIFFFKNTIEKMFLSVFTVRIMTLDLGV